jgi:hypothetical protein
MRWRWRCVNSLRVHCSGAASRFLRRRASSSAAALLGDGGVAALQRHKEHAAGVSEEVIWQARPCSSKAASRP